MKAQKRNAREYFKDLASLFFIFFRIGAFLFGGGYAMLALLEAEVVDKKHYVTKDELGDIFAIAESTPGAIAINCATFIGTRRCGILGGIVATLGVVIPAFAIIAVLSVVLDLVKDNKWVGFLFKGIRIGVLVLILKSTLSFFKNMRKTLFSFVIMAAAFVLVFVVRADVIYIMLGTIVVCSVAVALSTLITRKKYFVEGTAPYFCERVGMPLEKDEYFSKKAVDNAVLTIKSPDCVKTEDFDIAPLQGENAPDTATPCGISEADDRAILANENDKNQAESTGITEVSNAENGANPSKITGALNGENGANPSKINDVSDGEGGGL